MSSAWTSVSPNSAIRSALGSSALRMMRMTLSIDSSASCRPSRMWMRRSTSPSRCRVRRVTVSRRNSIHSASICCRFFERGRPSRPSITRLTGRLASSRVCASISAMNSAGSCRHDFGSSTMRTGERLVRLVADGVERAEQHGLQVDLVLRERLLALLRLRVRRALDVLQHRPRRHAERQLGDGDPPLAARQLLDGPAGAHAQAAAPALVDGADRLRLGNDVAAAGEVGPRDVPHQPVEVEPRVADQSRRRRGPLRRGCATGCRSPCRRRCPTRR